MTAVKPVPFADYHTHTIYSHGTGTIEENVLAARKRGLCRIAISDHGPANPFIGVKHVKTFRKMKEEIDRLNDKYHDIEVLLGVEANVISRDGDLDVNEEVLKLLDILLVGLHPIVIPKDLDEAVHLFGAIAAGHHLDSFVQKARRNSTCAIVNAVLKYDVDIVTHPGLHVPIDTIELAQAAKRRGTALEINASHPEEAEEFVRIAHREGVKFALGSDAHCPADVGRLEPALDIVERFNIPAELIINCR